jgi:ubiquinone/menaquinone biosynthesis C-methylase UbiE
MPPPPQTRDYKTLYYPESRFGDFTDIDGNVIFYCRVNALLHPDAVVLDVGCGRGALMEDAVPFRQGLRVLKGKCRKVIGIDVDEEARLNPFLDEFRLITGDQWPVPDQSVDVVISITVLEHVEHPDAFFAELSRVLKPGGYLGLLTGNVLSYGGLISWLIPDKFHCGLLKTMQPRRGEIDIFPKYYRCNTVTQIRGMLSKYGFDHCVYGYEAEPSYFAFSRLLYFLGVLHQRFSPKMIKPAIFAFARKVEAASS